MNYPRMFALLDFLEEVRTNPVTGNILGHNKPVVFSMEQLYDFSPRMSNLFKESGFLETMLDILDSETLGDKNNSPKICRENYKKLSDSRVVKYEVDITTKTIRAYKDWLTKQTNKSQLELRKNYLYFGDNKIELHNGSRPYLIIKYLISKPLHQKIKLTEIKNYLNRFPSNELIETKHIYNALGDLKYRIMKGLTGETVPWDKVKEKCVILEL